MRERGYGRFVNVTSYTGAARQHRPGRLRGGEGGRDRVHENGGPAGYITGAVLPVDGGISL